MAVVQDQAPPPLGTLPPYTGGLACRRSGTGRVDRSAWIPIAWGADVRTANRPDDQAPVGTSRAALQARLSIALRRLDRAEGLRYTAIVVGGIQSGRRCRCVAK